MQNISEGLLLPPASNFSGIETVAITADVHQSVDFSNNPEVENIKLIDGTTIDDTSLTITLADKQSLYLNNLRDGDIESTSVDDGGIIIAQQKNANSLKVYLDKIGPETPIGKDSLIIDFSNPELITLDLNVINTNNVNISNSGGKLEELEIIGSGALNFGLLPTNLSRLNGSNSTVDFTLISESNINISTSEGMDFIQVRDGQSLIDTGGHSDSVSILGGSQHEISTGSGNDDIALSSGGINTVNMGPGEDNITVNTGDNTISLGSGNNVATIKGGSNTLVSGVGDDNVYIESGTNTIETGDGRDNIIVSGGSNNITTSSGNDSIRITGGVNSINAGEGDDTILATGGVLRSFEGGAGIDQLRIISTGNVTLPTFSGFEEVFISNPLHQSLDYSLSPNLTDIELASGTTVDGGTMILTLGAGQSLKLDAITDGDTAAASLADGGIQIVQASPINSLDLTLDDVGPATSITNENVFIDIAGTAVSTAKVTSGNTSFVVISNSGGALTGIELLGAGSMALGTLPTSITNINGSAASANLTLTIGSSGTNTISGGTGNDGITLTGGTNDVDAGAGDDTITTSTNLVPGDRIDGGDGTDTFEVIHTGLATIPSVANLTSIERISIQDTVHQDLDFSSFTTITGIELDTGTTVDGATITTTLRSNQTLTLDSITDGDTAAASLADGGLKIDQANSITSLNLTLDDIGPTSNSTNANVFIDIAGTGVATADITSANTSFIVLENSGNALNTLNLTGSGTLGMQGTLANSITTINGLNSSANLTITSGTGDDTITGGSGNDTITLTGGTNNVTGGDGNDVIILSTGNDTVVSGNGNDDITAAGGTNNITTGANNDEVTLTGGNNTVNTGNNNDEVTISGGSNNVDTGSGSDQITISGGTNTVATGSSNDTVNASNGNNDI